MTAMLEGANGCWIFKPNNQADQQSAGSRESTFNAPLEVSEGVNNDRRFFLNRLNSYGFVWGQLKGICFACKSSRSRFNPFNLQVVLGKAPVWNGGGR